jgi:hypothetical protein
MRISNFMQQEKRNKKWIDWQSSNRFKKLNLNVKLKLKHSYCAD